MGVRYTGLGCIIRPDMGAIYDTANDAQNPQEELDQSILLTGNEFYIDNIHAFPQLQAATKGTYAYFHIYPYEETNNTHACMDDMRSHFLSESYNIKMIAISQNVLKPLRYTGASSGKFEANYAEILKLKLTCLSRFKIKMIILNSKTCMK